MKKGQSVPLIVRKARAIEDIGYFRAHPNIVVRIGLRLAIALSVATFLLGLAASEFGL